MSNYKEIFESSFDGIYIVEITPEGRFRFVDANPSFLHYIGKTREMVVDTYLDELDNEQHKEILTKKYQACLDAGKSVEYFNDFDNLSTGHKYFQSILNPAKDKNGQIYRIVVVVRDITEHRKRDKQLQMADLALNIITDAVYLIDKNLRVLYVNQAACDSLGYTKEELLSLTPFDFDPTLTTGMSKNITDTLRDGNICRFETKHRRKDGSVFDVAITTYPYMGDEIGLHIVKDITACKKSEDRLKLLTKAVDSSFDSVFLINSLDGSFLYVNDTAAKTLGYTKEELVGGMGVFDIDPGFTDTDRVEHLRVLDKSKRIVFQTHHRAKDGRIYPVEVVTNSVSDEFALSISRDISAEVEANKVIDMLTNAINASGDSVFLIDPKNDAFLYVNDTVTKVLGYTKEELTGGMCVSDIVPSFNDPQVRIEFLEKLEGSEDGIRFESKHKTKNGEIIPVEVHAKIINLANQRYALSISRDIIEKKAAEENLKLLASVFTNAKEGIVITDVDANIVDVNEAYTQMTGYAKDELIGNNTKMLKSDKHDTQFFKTMWDEIKTNKFWSGEIWNKRKNGELYVERLTISAVCAPDGEITHFIGLQTDITTLKDYECKLEKMAFYDTLTGLANRALLVDRINQAISMSKRFGTLVAVCYLDLDGFKPVNDSFGHEAGDVLLGEIAGRMQGSVRGSDTVARVGGDEFAILLLDVKSQRKCEEIIKKILERINEPYSLPNNESVRVGASVGVTLFPKDDSDSDILLRRADQAMYMAKQSGKNKYVFYT